MVLNPDRYRLTEEQHQAIFDRDIKPALFSHAKAAEQPVAVVFGGQPGAGKSPAVEAAMRELQPRGGAVEIIGDDLRAYHPQFARLMAADDKTAAAYTDRDTGRWVEKAIAEASARRVNLVIEGTMRDADKVATTMKSLRGAGYEVDARALAVNARFSEQGILQRYEAQKADRGAGRMTTPEAHQAAFEGLPRTLERIERDKLADRVTLYRRGAEAIYTNELQGGQWVKEPRAAEALDAERNRPMTLAERRALAQSYDQLTDRLAKPERGATAEERQKLDELRRGSKDALAAEVFRREPAQSAAQQHPELAPAFAHLRATEAQTEALALTVEQRAIVVGRVRENLAAQIERGNYPSLQLREERQASKDLDRGPSR